MFRTRHSNLSFNSSPETWLPVGCKIVTASVWARVLPVPGLVGRRVRHHTRFIFDFIMFFFFQVRPVDITTRLKFHFKLTIFGHRVYWPFAFVFRDCDLGILLHLLCERSTVSVNLSNDVIVSHLNAPDWFTKGTHKHHSLHCVTLQFIGPFNQAAAVSNKSLQWCAVIDRGSSQFNVASQHDLTMQINTMRRISYWIMHMKTDWLTKHAWHLHPCVHTQCSIIYVRFKNEIHMSFTIRISTAKLFENLYVYFYLTSKRQKWVLRARYFVVSCALWIFLIAYTVFGICCRENKIRN